MGNAAVWTTQMLWDIIPGALRTVFPVLVSPINFLPARPSHAQWMITEVNNIFFILHILYYYSVFGFLNASFSGVEQGPGHSLPVGYLKGASQGPSRNIPFDVTNTPGTASEFTIVYNLQGLHGTINLVCLAGSAMGCTCQTFIGWIVPESSLPVTIYYIAKDTVLWVLVTRSPACM